MSIEHTLAGIETALVKLPDTPDILAFSPRTLWSLTQILLGGVLLVYLLGVVQDFQRVRDLRAEPSTLSKVIVTKNEAWQRIYVRPNRSGITDSGTRSRSPEAPRS